MRTQSVRNPIRMFCAFVVVLVVLPGLLKWLGSTTVASDQSPWQYMGRVSGVDIALRQGRAGGEDIIEVRATKAARILCQASAPYRGYWELQPAVACAVQEPELKMYVFSAADPTRFRMFDGPTALAQTILGAPKDGSWPIIVNWGVLAVAPQFRVGSMAQSSADQQ